MITYFLIANNQSTSIAAFVVLGSVTTGTLDETLPSMVLANKGKNGSLIIQNSIIANNVASSGSGGGGGFASGLDSFVLNGSVVS